MSKGNGWIPLDKELKKSLPKDGRPYTPLEAMFSFSCDIDDGNKWTIKGYSKLWGWSRCKVRSFVNSIRHPTGHTLDTLKTHLRHTVHFIDKGLWEEKDTLKTPFRHPLDTPLDPTIYPNPNPNPNPKNNKKIYGEFQNVKLSENEHKKLVKSFGQNGTEERIEKLSQYVASKGKRYKSHYATILSWERKPNERIKGINRQSGFQDARESGKTDWLK